MRPAKVACCVLAIVVCTSVAAADDRTTDARTKGAGTSVLVSEARGSPAARRIYSAAVRQALEEALADHDYRPASDRGHGDALVRCSTPECNERVLRAAESAFALVPAVWTKTDGRHELTLTLVQKSGRNLNEGTVLGRGLSSTVTILLARLLAQHAERAALPEVPWVLTSGSASTVGRGARAGAHARDARNDERAPRGWVAGPVLFLAAGAATFVTLGVVVGMRDEQQAVDRGAVAAWSSVGAAALAGGTAWWIVGRRKRQAREASRDALPSLRVSPSGFDLRCWF